MVVLFGGYSPSIPTTYKNEVEASGYTYYADTFVSSPSYSLPSSPSTPKWKQVLTRGFPTYRAQARLFSDPHTGKTFLFGGYTNTQFISASSGKRSSRSYGDLWQLKLECPDGWFEGVDLEEEARTAKAGPWKRCFGCGSAGPWKKCGGMCCCPETIISDAHFVFRFRDMRREGVFLRRPMLEGRMERAQGQA